MSLGHGASVVRDGLVLHLDAANVKSYPGTGTTWSDLSGNGNHFTLDASGIVHDSLTGTFTLSDGGSAIRTSTVTTAANATVVFWIKTADIQALFLSGDTGTTGGYYLAAYRVGNKEYYGNCGSPVFSMDLIERSNVYDFLPDNQWHMVEFKSVNFLTNPWPYFKINDYSTYDFNNTSLSTVMIYEKNLSVEESLKNFEALRGRYGI